MSLRSTIRLRLTTRLSHISSVLTKLYAVELEMVEKSLTEYELESFGGERQKGKRVTLKQLRDEITYYENKYDKISQQLNGGNLVQFKSKRYVK